MVEDKVKTVKIRKINRPGFFGIGSYPGKTTLTYCAQLSKGGYKTGLTKEEETHYEKLLDLKPGELGKHSKWWGEVFNVYHAPRLNANKVTEIILDNPINELKHKVLLANDKIANSEYEKTPYSEFYIDNEEKRAAAEVEAFNYEFEGMALILKMTPEEKRDALRLFGKSGLEDSKEVLLNAELGRQLKKDPKNFVNILSDKHIKTRAFIMELVEKGIIKRKVNSYIYESDVIAGSTEECIAYFNDPNNQKLKIILSDRAKAFKKGKNT